MALEHRSMATSLSEQRKLQKRQRRKHALLLKREPDLEAHFCGEPTPHVFIGNGGLRNGLSSPLLHQLFGQGLGGKLSLVTEVCMPPEKDYAVATFATAQAAAEVVTQLNGACVQDVCRERELSSFLSPVIARGPPLRLFLFFVDASPAELFPDHLLGEHSTSPSMSEPGQMAPHDSAPLPSGLVLLQDYISRDEEAELLECFSSSKADQCTAAASHVQSPESEPGFSTSSESVSPPGIII